MKKLTATLCLTLVVLLGSIGMSKSADFQKRLDAYKSRDYATALREWTPLAEQGNADAQTSLSGTYTALNDYICGAVAEMNGKEKGGKLRNLVETK